MKSKGEVNLLFQNFYKMVHTQYNAHDLVFCNENMCLELQQYLDAHGIIHLTTYPNTP